MDIFTKEDRIQGSASAILLLRCPQFEHWPSSAAMDTPQLGQASVVLTRNHSLVFSLRHQSSPWSFLATQTPSIQRQGSDSR